MSLTQLVIDLIEDRGGETTVDDLMPEIKGHTRAQVMQALRNARFTKLIRIVHIGRGLGRGGKAPGIYAPMIYEPRPQESTTRPVSSVFQLGDIARAEHFDQRSRELAR